MKDIHSPYSAGHRQTRIRQLQVHAWLNCLSALHMPFITSALVSARLIFDKGTINPAQKVAQKSNYLSHMHAFTQTCADVLLMITEHLLCENIFYLYSGME